jgi:hypothetical protein
MVTRFEKPVILIWTFVVIVVATSTLYAPAAAIAVDVLVHKIHFVFFVLFPATLLLLVWIVRFVIRSASSDDLALPSEAWSLGLLVSYCLFGVLVTGGIAGSPLASLAAIVPLLSSSFLATGVRNRLLVISMCGVVLVGILSNSPSFSVPKQYPNSGGWETTGLYDTWIAMAVVLLGIGLDILISRRSMATGHELSRSN